MRFSIAQFLLTVSVVLGGCASNGIPVDVPQVDGVATLDGAMDSSTDQGNSMDAATTCGDNYMTWRLQFPGEPIREGCLPIVMNLTSDYAFENMICDVRGFNSVARANGIGMSVSGNGAMFSMTSPPEVNISLGGMPLCTGGTSICPFSNYLQFCRVVLERSVDPGQVADFRLAAPCPLRNGVDLMGPRQPTLLEAHVHARLYAMTLRLQNDAEAPRQCP